MKPLPRSHPHPFQSDLWNYLDQIRNWRRQKRTWREIAEALGTGYGIQISFQAVHDFFKRASRRKSLPLGFAPDQQISSLVFRESHLPIPVIETEKQSNSKQGKSRVLSRKVRVASHKNAVESPLLTPYEATFYLRVSNAGLDRMVREGKVPVVYIRSHRRFLRSDLDRYIADHSTC